VLREVPVSRRRIYDVGEDQQHHCRRYPPMQFVHEYDEPPDESVECVDMMTGALESYAFWFFPVVLATQWCGEFQPVKPA